MPHYGGGGAGKHPWLPECGADTDAWRLAFPAYIEPARSTPAQSRMAPPLLQLKDIALTFGGTALLTGAELSVSPGERVTLVGRNGSGKSTLLKIAAGLVEPDRGSVFVQPGALVRYLPQEPDFSGFASTLAYVEAGLRADRRCACRPLSARATRPYRTGRSGAAFGRRGAPRCACPRAGAGPRYSAARRADQSSRSDDHRMAGTRPRRAPLGDGHHQPRPAVSLDLVAQHGVARSRRDPPARTRVCAFRRVARCGSGGRGTRPAQARPQDRRRGALAALRRQRPAQTQHAPRRSVANAARAAAHLSRHGGRRRHHRRLRGAVRCARHRSYRRRQELWRSRDRCRLFNPHSTRRPARHRRAERQRQDHADQPAHRHACAGCRIGASWIVACNRDARSAARQP